MHWLNVWLGALTPSELGWGAGGLALSSRSGLSRLSRGKSSRGPLKNRLKKKSVRNRFVQVTTSGPNQPILRIVGEVLGLPTSRSVRTDALPRARACAPWFTPAVRAPCDLAQLEKPSAHSLKSKRRTKPRMLQTTMANNASLCSSVVLSRGSGVRRKTRNSPQATKTASIKSE